jgi:ribosomal protein L11 methyltransferase
MMADLWQITFMIPDQTDMVSEIMQAALDAEGCTIYRDDDADPWHVMLITATEPDENHVKKTLAMACDLTGQPQASVEMAMVPSRNWLTENRKSFPPLDIGSFWIYGSYVDDPVPEGKIGLKVDAGQAFGSGTHATTYGCIMMLEKHCPKQSDLKIADIGCGSGILAMAAAKIRSDARIIAADHDSRAVKTTCENANDNGVSTNITVDFSDGYKADLLQDIAPFDVIMANILPGPLIEMASDAVSCLADGGIIILSGLLENQQNKVISAHQALGLELVDRLVHDGWVSLVMRKA